MSALEDILSNIPVLGEFFGDSTSDLSRKQQDRYQKMHDRYMEQLEPMRDARMNALKQSMGLFEPMNDMMQRQYGYGYDFGSILKDPMRDFDKSIALNKVPKEVDSELQKWLDNQNRAAQGSAPRALMNSPSYYEKFVPDEYKDKVELDKENWTWKAK